MCSGYMTSMPLVMCREAYNPASTDTLQMRTGKRPDTHHRGWQRKLHHDPLQKSPPTHVRYDSMCMRAKQ